MSAPEMVMSAPEMVMSAPETSVHTRNSLAVRITSGCGRQSGSQRKKRKAGSGKAGSLFAAYLGVVALRLPNLGLWGGADLGSDHLTRHYQLDATILLTAFRGTV
jgi:hypothetical protein